MSDVTIPVNNQFPKTSLQLVLDAINSYNKNYTVFSYMDTANLATTTVETADDWTILQSPYINNFGEGWEIGTHGIKRSAGEPTIRVMADYMVGGQISKVGYIKIAAVLWKSGNADPFTSGVLTTGSIVSGSGGSKSAKTAGDDVNPRGFFQSEIEAGDEIVLVITAEGNGAVLTPEGGSASVHRVY